LICEKIAQKIFFKNNISQNYLIKNMEPEESTELLSILQKYFNYTKFKSDIQKNAIKTIVSGEKKGEKNILTPKRNKKKLKFLQEHKKKLNFRTYLIAFVIFVFRKKGCICFDANRIRKIIMLSTAIINSR